MMTEVLTRKLTIRRAAQLLAALMMNPGLGRSI